MRRDYDAVVVGSGPNGLAAAITIAQTGRSVLVIEAARSVGGGARTEELTLPGFRHDVCSAIHPLTVSSPFFKGLGLERDGLEWVQSAVPLAHPLDDGSSVLLLRSPEETARNLGSDGPEYLSAFGPMIRDWPVLNPVVLSPLRPSEHPYKVGRFGLHALRSARSFADRFRGARARALFAGLAAHSMLPLDRAPSAAFGLVLGIAAHAVGWPFPRGGAGRITELMADRLVALGGEVVTGMRIGSFDELPRAGACLLSMSPRAIADLAGGPLPDRYRRRLRRYRYGPGVFKVDWALSGPIPWRSPDTARAATVHIGGTYEEIAESESAPWHGETHDRPFVILAQHTLFDSSRAPIGKHTAWAYCHVPAGSQVDMSERIERQVERFAPGFRELILARSTRSAIGLEAYNPNFVGGDINCGVADLRQVFFRPVMRLNPYATPARTIYVCSSATPPGGGVHGMCGYHAARTALSRSLR